MAVRGGHRLLAVLLSANYPARLESRLFDWGFQLDGLPPLLPPWRRVRHPSAMSITTARTAVWPTFRYRDANAAIAFLVDAFGFEEVAVYRNDDGTVVEHADCAGLKAAA